VIVEVKFLPESSREDTVSICISISFSMSGGLDVTRVYELISPASKNARNIIRNRKNLMILGNASPFFLSILKVTLIKNI
jgi:hypothetical protein